MQTELENILRESFCFNSIADAKKYLKDHAKKNEWDSVCFEMKMDGMTLRYSDNCEPEYRYALGGNVKGLWQEVNF